MKRFALLAMLLVVPVLMACTATVTSEVFDTYSDVTVTMQEGDVEQLFDSLLNSGERPLVFNLDIDLTPGEITLSGNLADDDRAPISMTMLADSRDGELYLEWTAFSLFGFAVGAPGLADMNANLQSNLAESNAESVSDVVAVNIDDTQLSFVVRTPR